MGAMRKTENKNKKMFILITQTLGLNNFFGTTLTVILQTL